MTFILFQRDLRMLYGEREVFLREIEHIEDGILLAEVLTMMDGAYHLDNSLAFMHHLLLAIQSDDGEFALYEHTVVHHGMMMPTQFLACREHILHGDQFWTSLQIVGQFHTVPTL